MRHDYGTHAQEKSGCSAYFGESAGVTDRIGGCIGTSKHADTATPLNHEVTRATVITRCWFRGP